MRPPIRTTRKSSYSPEALIALAMLKLADLCPSLPECHNPRKRQEIPLLVARACPRRGRLTSFARHAGAFLLLRTSFGGGPQFSDGNRVVEPAGGSLRRAVLPVRRLALLRAVRSTPSSASVSDLRAAWRMSTGRACRRGRRLAADRRRAFALPVAFHRNGRGGRGRCGGA